MTPDAPPPLPRLFLIRHGDTDWTEGHKHTGVTDIPLNARGELHAAQLGQRLRSESFSRVFVSPLRRARRTCELAGFASRAEVNADLTEWNYGEDEGRFTSEIQRLRPHWSLFRDGAPGGESPDQVAARADRFIRLARTLTGDVAAFSSGQIMRMVAARWLGLIPLDGKCFCSATASVSILGYEHALAEPAILLWNEPTPTPAGHANPPDGHT